MDLRINRNPALARHLAEHDLFPTPFVLLDVGVYGGYSQRWLPLKPCLRVYGIDARQEAIDALTNSETEQYICTAVGNYDGEIDFFAMPGGGADSSVFEAAASVKRTVPMTRLDTLLQRGQIEPPDFIKIDVEGYERFVLEGAAQTLQSALGIELETNFNRSDIYPQGHITKIQDILMPLGFELCDITFDRSNGVPGTFDVLFCRRPKGGTEALKLAAIFDIYGNRAKAEETLSALSDSEAPTLIATLRTGEAFNYPSDPHILTNLIQEMKNSKTWRLTAPLRAIRGFIG